MILSWIVLWWGQGLAQPASEQQLNSIAAMGKLNGMALHCSYLEQVQQIKRALVLNLPKRRELGAWFEQATNESFMDFISKQQACPSQQDLNLQIEIASVRLVDAFSQ